MGTGREAACQKWPKPKAGLRSKTNIASHLEQSKQVIAVADWDLEEGEEHNGHNPDVEARLSSKEVGNGTGKGLGCTREIA